MSQRWAYIPFGNEKKWSTDGYITKSKAHYEKKFGPGSVIIGGFPTRGLAAVKPGLKEVGPEDTLIIIGHGSETNHNTISYKDSSNNYVSLVVNDLAEQLKNEDLNKQIRVIKLWMCYGGHRIIKAWSSATQSYIITIRRPFCFASVLAKALGARRFRQVVVGGFSGATLQGRLDGAKTRPHTIGYDLLTESGEIPDGKIIPAKSETIWYDTSGRVVVQPLSNKAIADANRLLDDIFSSAYNL